MFGFLDNVIKKDRAQHCKMSSNSMSYKNRVAEIRLSAFYNVLHLSRRRRAKYWKLIKHFNTDALPSVLLAQLFKQFAPDTAKTHWSVRYILPLQLSWATIITKVKPMDDINILKYKFFLLKFKILKYIMYVQNLQIY
jgi:hypothetical protein